MKHENEDAQATLPESARPAATPTMFDSAIPHSTNRSG